MKKLIIILLCLTPLLCRAQLMACRNVVEDGYDFWLYLPDDYLTSNTKKPVVLFLHGRSLSGQDLSLVRNYGCINAISRGLDIDAVVIAPQSASAWKPEKVMNVVEWVSSHYSVDLNRFYVMGMSMGGYGTLDFVATYPQKVAAAMALCGGATVPELCGLNEVPLWIIHGTADTAVPVAKSERVVEEMKTCGETNRLIFNRFEGVNHESLVRVFYLRDTYDWLFSHSLSDPLRTLNKDFSITPESLKTAYSELPGYVPIKVIDPSDGVAKKYYIVKKGDTLSSIAVENNTTVSLLCGLNKIKKNSILRVGKKLRVK